MIAYTCRRCGSKNVRKNGRTKRGHQHMHCRDCNFYSTLEVAVVKRADRYRQLDALMVERVGQRATARILHMGRDTIRAFTLAKKKP